MSTHDDDGPDHCGVRGGQGRSAEELWDYATCIAIAIIAACVGFIAGCIVGVCNAP